MVLTRITTCLVLITVSGCCTPGTGTTDQEGPVRMAPADEGPLLPSVKGIDATPLPGDAYRDEPKIGRTNESLFERQYAACERVLASVEPRLRQATPEALIGGLRIDGLVHGRPSNTVEYLVWRDGNKRIEEELARRGESARDALLRHADDGQSIFTGSNGPPETIGSMCRRLLQT